MSAAISDASAILQSYDGLWGGCDDGGGGKNLKKDDGADERLSYNWKDWCRKLAEPGTLSYH